MTDAIEADEEAQFDTDFKSSDPNDVLRVITDAEEVAEEFDIHVELQGCSDEEAKAVRTAVMNLIGHSKQIIGHDKYIDRGTYWALVDDYVEEAKEALDDDSLDLTDREIMYEIVMPSQMTDYYDSDPHTSFFTLMYSKHSPGEWMDEMVERGNYDNALNPEKQIQLRDSWTSVLESMAHVACAKDVASKLEREDNDYELSNVTV